ncbi:MAG: EscU/YscU/HrcU family type III secretion system export apparatus switch protein, partial [Isosphaeraceae bacterium]
MSEDRTLPPSKRRRQLAREQGQVAHSPELTASIGWLVAVLVLGFWGGDLSQGTIRLTRESMSAAPVLPVDTATVVAHVRGLMQTLFAPLGVVLAGFAAGATAAHQMQVRGLWAPALIAPDPARLWIAGRSGGLNAGLGSIPWALLKVIVLTGISLWLIRSEWRELERLSELEFPADAVAIGHAMLQPARTLALCMLILGLADYTLRYFRFETTLQTTREEQREDQRMMEGDLAIRSRRIRLARAWRGDAPELLAGASLILSGTGGLTLVLAGGP